MWPDGGSAAYEEIQYPSLFTSSLLTTALLSFDIWLWEMKRWMCPPSINNYSLWVSCRKVRSEGWYVACTVPYKLFDIQSSGRTFGQHAYRILVMPVTCITSRFRTHLGGSAFGPPTFFTILTDRGALTRRAVPKRVGWHNAWYNRHYTHMCYKLLLAPPPPQPRLPNITLHNTTRQ